MPARPARPAPDPAPSPAAAPRCRATSLRLDEPLRASATAARTWLLLEHPGPWGRTALDGAQLPAGLGAALARTSERLGIRVNLIRRHGRHQHQGSSTMPGRHVLLAHTGPDEPWIAQTVVDDPYEVLALDLAALARGERPDLRDHDGPLFAVCTHGRRDPCCAENGRPLARALSARFPARTWETTHLGGDRFAANLACFPHGLYFGRVPPERAVEIATAYRDGEVTLEHYRGRTCWPASVQAAEIWLRERTAVRAVDGIRLVSRTHSGDVTTVDFEVAGPATGDGPGGGDAAGRWTARVRARPGAPARLLSCRAEEQTCPTEHELLELTRTCGPS